MVFTRFVRFFIFDVFFYNSKNSQYSQSASYNLCPISSTSEFCYCLNSNKAILWSPEKHLSYITSDHFIYSYSILSFTKNTSKRYLGKRPLPLNEYFFLFGWKCLNVSTNFVSFINYFITSLSFFVKPGRFFRYSSPSISLYLKQVFISPAIIISFSPRLKISFSKSFKNCFLISNFYASKFPILSDVHYTYML